jgi:hypothetical protein
MVIKNAGPLSSALIAGRFKTNPAAMAYLQAPSPPVLLSCFSSPIYG